MHYTLGRGPLGRGIRGAALRSCRWGRIAAHIRVLANTVFMAATTREAA